MWVNDSLSHALHENKKWWYSQCEQPCLLFALWSFKKNSWWERVTVLNNQEVSASNLHGIFLVSILKNWVVWILINCNVPSAALSVEGTGCLELRVFYLIQYY